MNTQIRKLAVFSLVAMLVFSAGSESSRADDTEVYLRPNVAVPPGSEPMVMFTLDYRPNLASSACNGSECDTLIAEGWLSAVGPYTFFDVLRAVLSKVFDPLEGVRVGLMLNHDNGNNCEGFGQPDCSNGGLIAMDFTLFDAADSNGAKARFHQILGSIPVPQGGVSHTFQGKELFFEFFRYLTGQGVYNAHNGWTDYGTKNEQNLDDDLPGASWDTAIEKPPASKPTYDSPLASAGACTRIYTVNPMFQVSSQDDDSDTAIAAAISSGGFGLPQDQFANVIKYLNDADLADGTYGTVPDLEGKQNVTSYFIVSESQINNTTNGYAIAGGTGAAMGLSENPQELTDTLEGIFSQILSVSTTFVAASVPVNVFNRSEISNNIFIALFQVDSKARPSWVGNVKKLKLAGVNSSSEPGIVVDVLDNPAISADGRIRADALTHWTLPGDLPSPNLAEGEIAGRDGRSVARGGAGQRIPGFLKFGPKVANGMGGRTIYYDRTPTALANFNIDLNTATALQPVFGAADLNESLSLMAYARGLDIDDIDGDNNKTEARDWIFGDPLHSRPLPINYGAIGSYSQDNPAIFLAVGSNDGMLRMLRNTTGGGAESGEEVWAFMPKAAMPAQKVLRQNSSGAEHPYTLDGAPVAYIQDINHDGSIIASDGDKAYLYIGMRRGGKAYYALDVTNPEMPRLMWTIEKGGDFAELGYTFSTPRVGLVDTPSGPRGVVMFAGGYDLNKDTRGAVGTDDAEGNAIYIVDAETGALIWKARGGNGGGPNIYSHTQLVDSIPSALTVADTNGDGFIDRIVVGDTGGNIWRADLPGEDVSNWKLTLLASVGRHSSGASGVATDRRFFHRPDLVQSKDSGGLFDGVLIGSGDRADPLDLGGTVENWFYMIKDHHTAVGSGVDSVLEPWDFGDVTSNCLQSSDCFVDLTNGWRLQLTEPGEKVLATPLTLSSKVFFTTYLPQGAGASSACAPAEGAGRLYAVSFQDATAVINYDTSDDDPDNPGEPSTTNDRFTDLSSAGIPAEVVSVPPNKILRPDLQVDDVDATTRWRTYWYLQEDADL
jgi:type IV pilus assembly protein PilY1